MSTHLIKRIFPQKRQRDYLLNCICDKSRDYQLIFFPGTAGTNREYLQSSQIVYCWLIEPNSSEDLYKLSISCINHDLLSVYFENYLIDRVHKKIYFYHCEFR